MKKSAIPETGGQPTPDFVRAVKDNIEIVTGRRKNKLALPTLQVLTFSNPPTQAECQALAAYVNAWAKVLQAIQLRLDD